MKASGITSRLRLSGQIVQPGHTRFMQGRSTLETIPLSHSLVEVGAACSHCLRKCLLRTILPVNSRLGLKRFATSFIQLDHRLSEFYSSLHVSIASPIVFQAMPHSQREHDVSSNCAVSNRWCVEYMTSGRLTVLLRQGPYALFILVSSDVLEKLVSWMSFWRVIRRL